MNETAASSKHLIPRFATSALPLILFAILALIPLAGPGPNTIRLLFISLVWVTTSIAWNILGGFAGQVSFGFAVFYGLGAYTTSILLNAGVDRLSSLVLAGIVGVVASLFIGIPTFRLRGPYFAIATIGVSEAVRVVMTNLAVTGGASGYRISEKGAFNQHLHFYMALGLAAGAVAISMWVRNSKFGLALISIREDEDAASDLGVNPFATKLLGHALASALTAAAGGVYAGYAAFVHPNGVFGFDISVAILLMPIIGGV
jgi:branched-chain amino acid transport system permease protein